MWSQRKKPSQPRASASTASSTSRRGSASSSNGATKTARRAGIAAPYLAGWPVMELEGKVAVVTGAASGIGRALAAQLADEGAAGVVRADLDGAGAETAAGAIGERALGLACDVTDDAQVAALLERAEAAFGPVDVFCANAGVGFGTGLDAPDDEGPRVMAINAQSHVLA